MMMFKSLLTAGALLSASVSSVLAQNITTTPSAFNATVAPTNATVVANSTVAAGVDSTMLVLVRDQASGDMVTLGLKGYGIPYQILVVPQEGVALPVLNSSLTQGNYGGIIVLSELAFSYPTGWGSALTADQWTQLYNYQTTFKVRMTRLDVFPGPAFGKYHSVDAGFL
jgi:hypothetical protein